ncbi:MAG: signal recognition particle-docking protein FtsY [Gemmataceae bacterium]|nr:signal recognition particle-docking protein FtsY [Gemmataceae bacterium]MCI0739696.1 signal recognition particle-docking protein FtsY [Gemmataceae bacterium]
MVFRSFFNKIKQGLAKTRDLLSGIFRLKGRVDQKFLDELEKRLYLADVGTVATTEILTQVRQAFLDKEITGDVEKFVKDKLKALLDSPREGIRFAEAGPTVVLVAGVNGSGKTTSIAKLAKYCQDQKKKVIVAACDTFRAAAVEQLTIWSQRLGCEIIKNQQGSDPASVAHDACEAARSRKADVLIVDTAGRLHTQAHLMKELEKIHRVVNKSVPGAPHEVLLVLDATGGQNSISQAEHFKKAIQCTGIVLAKLDGTAKGGAIFGIKQKLNLPVKFVGVGEKLDDLEVFDPEAYVEALFND